MLSSYCLLTLRFKCKKLNSDYNEKKLCSVDTYPLELAYTPFLLLFLGYSDGRKAFPMLMTMFSTACLQLELSLSSHKEANKRAANNKNRTK